MSNKQAKRARAVAYEEAKRQDLWNKGEKSIFSSFKNRFLSFFSKSYRNRCLGAVSRWYKKNLKLWARQHYAFIHDPDYASFQRARKHVARSYAKKKEAIHG